MLGTRQARWAAVTASGLLAASLAAAAPGAAQVPRPELLPDLRPARAFDLTVEEGPRGRRELRFATAVYNRGAGPLELYPMRGNDCDGDGNPRDDRLAKQRVYFDDNGDRRFDRLDDESSTATVAGCMVFHRAHDHWHFEEFAAYRLLDPGSGRVVAQSSKVSFCVEDIDSLRVRLRGQPRISWYDACDPVHPQGISVGWADVYGPELPGQLIPLRGVRDGTYCLELVTDPANRLRERNDFDNASRTRVRLRDDEATRLRGECPAPAG